MSLTGHTSQPLSEFPAPAAPLPAPPPHVPSAESVHEQLNRIVSSRTFTRSKDLCRFLRFVVEQTLRNRTVRLKEYLIGVTVFRRGENFNPGTDPIVRVQACRLRSKLDLYYETEGWKDTLRIDLPSGRYIPLFRHLRSRTSNRGSGLERPAVNASGGATADTAVSTIMEEVSQAVADVLRAHLSKRAEPNPAETRVAHTEAHQLCRKGHLSLLEPTPEAIRMGTECFERAAERDPDHAPAYAGLATIYAAAGVTGIYPISAAMARVKSLAAKALHLDGRSAEARAAHALAIAVQGWNFQTAEKEFHEALDLSPGLASAHHWYAIGGLLPFGFLDRAILELKVALEFASHAVSIQTDLAWALCLDRRYEEALARCRGALDAAPGFFRAHWVLGLINELQNKLDSALASYDSAARLTSTESVASVAASQGYASALAGRRDEALRHLEALMDRAPSGGISLAVATVYLGLGDITQTFEWLQRAVAEREGGLIWLNVDPRFARLRIDTRFEKIITQVHLTPGLAEMVQSAPL
jgi:tetratricopeptide (TPR) repeat protein